LKTGQEKVLFSDVSAILVAGLFNGHCSPLGLRSLIPVDGGAGWAFDGFLFSGGFDVFKADFFVSSSFLGSETEGAEKHGFYLLVCGT
jgi:hypothetical protein